ncbi:glucose-6-phosphate dehydrogenase [Paenibacillus sp. SC116]|uniref:glucose-6-phosphate dehydrogenase n=1 Tax=Paenibacillus sp. SC116 TaxID=2968986 RepID=UPI00215B1539|nr:glucose-6-phosphate dehydrogenase [Paenibacillus sp. SC116]MCR8845037.1 glucose-6-phosphate dehydrogenase [Paenibacillus sp. SC116]
MEPATFVLFGSTGDLAKRKIFPALFNLYIDGKMPSAFSIIGMGRKHIEHTEFQETVRQSLNTFSRREPGAAKQLDSFLQAIRYQALDVTRPEDYKKLFEVVTAREAELNLPQNRMFYLSVAPEYFDTIAQNIKLSGLGDTTGWKRLVIEKPFGHDLASARELNKRLSKAFAEDEVFRIDHYLGKTMVQNLEVLEISNPVLHALWNNRYINNVQITASETVGLEGRAEYYDQAGAIRDMFQNHMLQLLMMIAMHLPKGSKAEDIRNRKKRVLEALRPLQKEEVAATVVRGQYEVGTVNDNPVVSYIDEPGIDSSSQNDTFIAARLWIDDTFWSEVPFYIRTGKRMKEKSTRIVIEFKDPMNKYYSQDPSEPERPNLLVIEISPNERITFQLNSKNVAKGEGIEPIQIDYKVEKEMPEAYENLIYDAFRGDASFFAHWDEVELSWKFVQPILEAFEENLVPLYKYKSGSYGPAASEGLVGQDGNTWWLDSEGKPLNKDMENLKKQPVMA